jgi:hypothetical protein
MARSFLERYQSGEHEQVWADLTALGTAIQDGLLYSDALAVAHETMRRVRRNIEILIPRLRQLGYEFGYEFGYAWATRFPPTERLEMEQDAPVFAAPSPDIAQGIRELDRRAGTLPLSLHAFLEVVGEVNFIGSHPTWEYEKLDPLEVLSARSVLKLDDWGHWTDDREKDGSCNLPVAPDEYHKYFYSGAGPYAVPCLNPVADAPLLYERHETTFVNYLRVSFRWGGFPGWERVQQRPEQELSFLTADLLPI